MFENIIGQDGVVETLRRELAGGSFPQAVLFHGPPYAGKLSAALETARVLSCEEGSGDWSCPCRSCASQRLLAYPYTLLLGSRYFDLEIAVSADVLKRTRRSAAQYLFLRAVRKLTRRFDPVLWEGEENRIKGLAPVLGEVEERLEALAPGSVLAEERELEKEVERIGTLCQKISSFLSEDNIPINQIRRAVYWMHLSSASRRKVVIMENADRMYDASRNSLLKILEEPPETATLILLATNRGGILPTIRSRLRTYEFAERSPEEVGLVLKKIFQDETAEYAGMGEYFLSWREVNPRVVSELARRAGACAAFSRDALHGSRRHSGIHARRAGPPGILASGRHSDILVHRYPRGDEAPALYPLGPEFRIFLYRRTDPGVPHHAAGAHAVFPNAYVLVENRAEQTRRAYPVQPEPQPRAGVSILQAERGRD